MLKRVFSVLWRPEHAMSYAVATQADTSSNQAIKDPGQWRCGYNNLGKIVIKYVPACGRSAGKSRFPTSSEQGKKWPAVPRDRGPSEPSPPLNPHLHLIALQLCRSRHLSNSGQLVLESSL